MGVKIEGRLLQLVIHFILLINKMLIHQEILMILKEIIDLGLRIDTMILETVKMLIYKIKISTMSRIVICSNALNLLHQ